MIEGALILLGGIVLGRLLPNRRTGQKPVKDACGCGHHMSMHAPTRDGSGACHGFMKNPAYSSYYVASKTNPLEIQCTCKQYVGPIPADQIVASFQPKGLN